MTLSALKDGAARVTPLLVLLFALLLMPQAAFAHAKLTRSEPKAAAKLDRPPGRVELWFSDELAQGLATVEVTDAQGGRVESGEVTLADANKKAQVELKDLPPGTYTVAYRVVSTDEHTIRGKFSFSVTAAAGSAATPAQPQGTGQTGQPPPPAAATATPDAPTDAATSGEAEGSTITWADNAVRWIAYLAMMTLFGGFAAWLLVLTPALRRARGPNTVGADGEAAVEEEIDDAVAGGIGTKRSDEAVTVGARRTVKLFRIALVVLVAALAAALVYQSSAVNGVSVGEAASPALLARVITKTGYGTAWLVTALAAAALAVIVFMLGRALDSSRAGADKLWWWAGLVASGAMFVGPSLTGHAMAASRLHHFAVVSDWLHLVAGGFWVGGLFHLALALPPALARLDAGRRAPVLGRVITLFTRVAIPSVAAVFVAGVYNAWIHVGSFGALWGTAYGRTLLVKVGLTLPMLALGALNGFRFGPRADRLAAETDAGGELHSKMERGFVRSLKVEAALGVLVLLAAAVLVFLTPGRNERQMNMDMSGGPAEQTRGGR